MKAYTISGRRVNLYSLLFVLPILLLYAILYLLIWRIPGTSLRESFIYIIYLNKDLLLQAIDNIWLVLLVILSGIVAHELIHGICMSLFAKNGFRSVSFGFNIKALAPFAHCKEPLTPAAYRISLVMPALLLGDIPALTGLLSGNILTFFFGVLFTLAASGDIIVLWVIRKIHHGMLQDHPSEVGCMHII